MAAQRSACRPGFSKGPRPLDLRRKAERIQIIFRRGVYVAKNPSHEAKCRRLGFSKGRCPLDFRHKAEKTQIIFPGDMCGGKNPSHEAKCRRRSGGTRAQCPPIRIHGEAVDARGFSPKCSSVHFGEILYS